MAEGQSHCHGLDVALRDIPGEKLNQKCSDDDLNRISMSFTRWPEVSPWLGLTEADEEELFTIGSPRNYVKRQRLDVLRRWKEKQEDKATYRSLIDVFFRAQRLDMVDVVIEVIQNPTIPVFLPSPSHCNSPHSSALAEYGEFLKELYAEVDDVPTPSVHWPPVPVQKAFKLAMIHQKKVDRREEHDEYVHLTITGKVDDILHVKTPVRLEDIFHIDDKSRKVILVEGAPGSGKSTLSGDICKRWGEGELFQEYEAVVLVQLRDPKVRAASSLADILPADNRAMAESVASVIRAAKGQNVLFILDGWDELPLDLQRDSFFHSLIRRQLLDSSLRKSAIIVTSRPISSSELHPLASARVEIVGFTPEEQKEYFTECLSGDSRAVETLLDRIEENPLVASSCYLPLNAAIIVHLFLLGSETLPTTTHGIFTSVVLCCLSRYLKDRLGFIGEAATLQSLHNLPESLQGSFRQLCSLAFFGVMEDRITFSSEDLQSLGISLDILDLGLLQALQSIVSHRVSVYYNFLHLLIQELLAAYHISSLPGSEQISHFQKLYHQPRFAAVLQFYAGITGFQSERKYLSKVSFLLPTRLIPTSLCDIITNIVRRGHKRFLVSLIHCLYEADDPSLCHYVATQLYSGMTARCDCDCVDIDSDYFVMLGKSFTLREKGLNLIGTTLSPLDCLSVGYFLSCVCASTKGEFSAYLSRCSIDDHSCQFLMKGLSRHARTGQLKLHMGFNTIGEEGAQSIAQVLRNTNIVQTLCMYHCMESASTLKYIAEALTSNSSVTELNLGDTCTINEENGPVITEMLQMNTTLEVLEFHSNRYVSEVRDIGAHYVAEGLKQNTSVKELNLTMCAIGDEGVNSLGQALVINESLQQLSLRRNRFCITERGLSVLVECLKTNRGLTKLYLDKEFRPLNIEKAVNVVRRRNKARLLTVSYPYLS